MNLISNAPQTCIVPICLQGAASVTVKRKPVVSLSFDSFLIKRLNLVSFVPMWSKKDDRAEYSLEEAHFMIGKSPECSILGFSGRSIRW